MPEVLELTPQAYVIVLMLTQSSIYIYTFPAIHYYLRYLLSVALAQTFNLSSGLKLLPQGLTRIFQKKKP